MTRFLKTAMADEDQVAAFVDGQEVGEVRFEVVVAVKRNRCRCAAKR